MDKHMLFVFKAKTNVTTKPLNLWPWHIGPKLQVGEREDPGIAGHRH
jgi:hypothetical protein